MRYRKLDSNGDYTIGQREGFVTGRAAVGQAIKTRLRLLLGEWWEDEEDGLPLFEQILGSFRGEGGAEDIDLLISERIAGTEHVTGIAEFDSSFDTAGRAYLAVCKVNTDFGAVEVKISAGSEIRVELGG